MKITIKEPILEKRLDKYLALEMPEFSRSQLQKLIADQLILVDGNPTKAHAEVSEGQVIEVVSTSRFTEPRPTTSPLFDLIEIIDEQPDYLIINKPVGLIIHEAVNLQEPTLVDWLVKKYPHIKEVGEDKLRPGIVHRLDKDVSGLLVVALTQPAFIHFKKLFQGRRLKKIYTALVHGEVQRDTGVIDFVIERSVGGHKMAARPKNQEGKPSETHFTVLKRYLHYTLLEILIKTGRTHQIRAHLAAYSNPIVGDNLYGTHTSKLVNKKLNTARIYLMASQLAFTDLHKVKKHYTLELPENFTKIFSKIK